MLDRAQQADPTEFRVWFRRGEIQMKRGDYAKAIESFAKAKNLGVDAARCHAKIKECKEALAGRNG